MQTQRGHSATPGGLGSNLAWRIGARGFPIQRIHTPAYNSPMQTSVLDTVPTFLRIGVLLGIVLSAHTAAASDDVKVNYTTHVRPILSEHCFPCHGFDEKERKAGLRLDQREGAFALLDSGAKAIVPGQPLQSALVHRTQSTQADSLMPPADYGRPLSAGQIETLEKWILQGAPWEEHWSLAPIGPAEADSTATAAERIDQFIQARLEGTGLSPSDPANPITLLRRVSYDLTGLPPTPEEVAAFVADPSEQAYESAVRRLLESPRYGEHMARYWLDAARYGDTHGLHLDNERSMWPYRDWVISAFNDNKSFDEFVIEQIAGDLLPDATIDQRIASGFNRCNVTSNEGGMIAAEYLSLYAKDRVETTATVFLGLTFVCAKCHDHKYDPVSMRDYYSLSGFFNSMAEEAGDRNILNPKPSIQVPNQEQAKQLAEFSQQVSDLDARLKEPDAKLDAAQLAWEAQWQEKLADRWLVLVPESANAQAGTQLEIQRDDSVLATGLNPSKEVYEITSHAGADGLTAIKLEALLPVGAGNRVPGRSSNNNFVLTHFALQAYPAGHPELAVDVPLASVSASFSQINYPVEGALDPSAATGWAGLGQLGNRQATFIAKQPFGYPGGTGLRVILKQESRFSGHNFDRVRLSVTRDRALVSTALGPWKSLGPIQAADGRASLAKDFGPDSDLESSLIHGAEGLAWVERPDHTDGAKHTFEQVTGVVYLYRELTSATARSVSIGLGSDDGLRVWLNGHLVHNNPTARALTIDNDLISLNLRKGKNTLLLKVANYGGGFGYSFNLLSEDSSQIPETISAILELPGTERNSSQAQSLQSHFRAESSPEWRKQQAQLSDLQAREAALTASLPYTLVSEDLPRRRPAHILTRGQYDQLGEQVQPDVPSALPPMETGAPPNRLGLAQWLVREDHPLTARVTVNRFWQQFFGTGIVRTSEDFGVQGELPSHPQLLDWLARFFIDSGWDVKEFVHALVTSKTYRQATRPSEAARVADPYNRLLASGPRFRLDGEMVRDTALFLSHSLVDEIGGPSVRPYQPAGVWKAVGYSRSNTVNYKAGQGPDLYRRSLYTFWKRTAPPPSMVAFDAPSREQCTVRRARTNTPLQSLALLNDVQMVEAARGLAKRILTECQGSLTDRAQHGFRLVTSRTPSEQETQILLQVIEEQLSAFTSDPAGADALVAMGARPAPEGLATVELAAWTHVSLLLLNLDEVITRG